MSTPRSVAHERIEECQALVLSLASKIHRSIPVRMDLDDLIAYGEVGLAEAAASFDPQYGSQFSTYAFYRIRGAIYDGISKMSWTSRARYRRHRFQQMANEALARDAAESNLTGDAGLAEQATWFQGISEKLAVVYLASQAGDESEFGSDFQDPSESAATLVAQREIGQRLHQLVAALPNLEAKLIETIYFEGANLKQAANHLGISKSWASRLHTRALEKLARDLAKIDSQNGSRQG
jgi:RNA polymerase sigma factor for flagellar operon FliA